ncbi:MAG TPA: lysine--tRNA ligase [Tenericutes bacterium]|nr:lysine--tRNA ligase [Mycoplasmatota bacterium]
MREFSEQELVRRAKIEEIRKFSNPYPERFETNYELKDVSSLEDGVTGIRIAGRIVLMRKMGKLSFLTIRDIAGSIQISIKIDLVGEEKYNFFKDNFDLGDFIGVEGEMFTTHTGEKTVRATDFVFLGKALRPLPEKFHGLTDPEACYRNRYLDLIMNEDTRKRFLLKFEFIKQIRRYLEERNYIEIETPVLINKPSGALARPFKSHHNALDIDVYLRIAPETYLKRAVVGGFNKVFEFARCFRNEGIDATHLQDFTMLEAYCSYYNYKDTMVLVEDMLKTVINNVFGSLMITIGDKEIDLSKKWETVSFRELILKYIDIDINEHNTKEKLLNIIKEKNITLESETDINLMGFGNLVDLLYKKVARPQMIEPVFLVEHPIELSPLARANDENSSLTDRFQLVINGAEIINAYSELVDPIEQERRLEEQSKLNAGGDEEAMVMDREYIEAMEYGMPPISGWGMGIDRVLQVLTDVPNIKDNVLFPMMRPQEK